MVSDQSRDYSQVSTGGRYVYALDKENRLFYSDRILDASEDNTLAFTPLDDKKYETMDAGNNLLCGLQRAGDIQCWRNLVEVQLPPGIASQKYRELAIGEKHACAISAAGRIECWGCDRYLNSIGACTPPLGNFLSIDVAVEYACGLTSTDHVVCWGGKRDGFHAPGSELVFTTHSGPCAIREGGNWLCSTKTDTELRRVVDGDGGIKTLDSGFHATVGIGEEGHLLGWGSRISPDPWAERRMKQYYSE